MTTNSDLNALLTSIQSTLSRAYIPPLSNRIARWALYEVYIFCLILEGARRRGVNSPVFRNGNGSATPPYRFRIGPGRISATDPYTYAILDFRQMNPPKLPLEVPERSVTPRGLTGFDCHHINNKAIYRNKKS